MFKWTAQGLLPEQTCVAGILHKAPERQVGKLLRTDYALSFKPKDQASRIIPGKNLDAKNRLIGRAHNACSSQKCFSLRYSLRHPSTTMRFDLRRCCMRYDRKERDRQILS